MEMRIVHFSDHFYPELGGIQDCLLTTTREFGRRGHEVVVYAPSASREDYEIANRPIGEPDLGENVTIRRVFSLPFPSSTRQSRLIIPTGQRWRGLANFKPNIIHTHTFFGAGFESLSAARRLRVPLVGTNHMAIGEFSVYVPFTTSAFFARNSIKAVTWFHNHCDFVSGPSRSVLDEMRAFGLQRPHAVISNPIDTALFHPASPEKKAGLKSKLSFSKATILYAGRLAIEKNIDVLIHAVAAMKTDVPDVMLALAGHGRAQSSLQALARAIGVAHRVKFLGTLDQRELAEAFQAADVFAIASTSETQSMVLLQAMSSGLPAVGARWRALKEYISSDSGLLAEPGEPGDVARKLTTILKQPLLREFMGSHATCIAADFSVANVIGRWEDIYAAIIGAFRDGVERAT